MTRRNRSKKHSNVNCAWMLGLRRGLVRAGALGPRSCTRGATLLHSASSTLKVDQDDEFDAMGSDDLRNDWLGAHTTEFPHENQSFEVPRTPTEVLLSTEMDRAETPIEIGWYDDDNLDDDPFWNDFQFSDDIQEDDSVFLTTTSGVYNPESMMRGPSPPLLNEQNDTYIDENINELHILDFADEDSDGDEDGGAAFQKELRGGVAPRGRSAQRNQPRRHNAKDDLLKGWGGPDTERFVEDWGTEDIRLRTEGSRRLDNTEISAEDKDAEEFADLDRYTMSLGQYGSHFVSAYRETNNRINNMEAYSKSFEKLEAWNEEHKGHSVNAGTELAEGETPEQLFAPDAPIDNMQMQSEFIYRFQNLRGTSENQAEYRQLKQKYPELSMLDIEGLDPEDALTQMRFQMRNAVYLPDQDTQQGLDYDKSPPDPRAIDVGASRKVNRELEIDNDNTDYIFSPLESQFLFTKVKTFNHHKTTPQGRRESTAVLYVAGNGKGCGAYGYGRGRSEDEATTDAFRDIFRNLLYIPLTPDRNLWSMVEGKARSSHVQIHSTIGRMDNKGSMLITLILELLGIRGATAQTYGSKNLLMLVRATFAALGSATCMVENSLARRKPVLPSNFYSKSAFVLPNNLNRVYDPHMLKEGGHEGNQDGNAILYNLDRIQHLQDKFSN